MSMTAMTAKIPTLPVASRRPRIAVAASGLGHVARGIEAWASDLGQVLAGRGAAVLLCKGAGTRDADYQRVVPCWPRESPRTVKLLNRLPRFLGWRLGMGSSYAIEQTTFAWNLIRLLRKERIDILHVQDPQVAMLAQRARSLRWISTRTILAHGTEESLEFQRRIDFLQHLAPWHLEQARTAGVWKPTWTAIPNFVDTEQFAPGPASALRRELNIPDSGIVVLTAAAIEREHKRIDYLIREFAALRQQRPELLVWLVVAGGWESDTDALVAEGKRLLGEHVRFLVRFPRVRMPELYRAVDLFVLASLKEMMPIALLEATASGLPCVVHRHPIMQWITGPGGRHVDLSRDGVLAAELERLALSDSLRRSVGELARAHCETNFGRDAVVDQIEAYYQQVFSSARQTVLATN